jgi:hypothetical protein
VKESADPSMDSLLAAILELVQNTDEEKVGE